MACNKKYKDLRYLFIRGLLHHEAKQRRVHYLKSAAECTSRAIVSLELCEHPIKSVHQAEKLQGIGGETKKRLQTYNAEGQFDDSPPKVGKFVSSAGAILLALLESTEKALAENHREDEVVLVQESEVKGRACQLSEEPFLKDHDDGLCAAWWRMEVLIKRDLVKRRTLNKQPVYQLLPLGMEAARLLKTHFTYPVGTDPNQKTVKREEGQENFLYTNDSGHDGVILQVDHRELGGDRLGLSQLCDLLSVEGLTYRTQQLKIGDYQWVWRCDGQEHILPCVVERKRIDDMARTLKEGRFWTQVTKMKGFKSEFEEKGVACVVHYLVEGNPENYVVRCGDGCQGVGRCGYPSLQQVKCAFRDLAGDKDLVTQATDDLQDTVAVIASLTSDLQQRTRKGDFDQLVAMELEQPSESRTKATTTPKDVGPKGSKVTVKADTVCVDSDSKDSLDAGLRHQRSLGSKVKQTERSPKDNSRECSLLSKVGYPKENTPPQSCKISGTRWTQKCEVNYDGDHDVDLDTYRSIGINSPEKPKCPQISNNTYSSRVFQKKSVSNLNMSGSSKKTFSHEKQVILGRSPPELTRRRELPPLEPLVQYHCAGSYSGPSPSKRSRETSVTAYKPKMTSYSNSDVGYRSFIHDETDSYEEEITPSYRPKVSSDRNSRDDYQSKNTAKRDFSTAGKYRPKVSVDQRQSDEFRSSTTFHSPEHDRLKTNTYRPKVVSPSNEKDVYKSNVSSFSYGSEFDDYSHSEKAYRPKLSTTQDNRQMHEPKSPDQHVEDLFNQNSCRIDSLDITKTSARGSGVYKSPVNDFGKRKMINLNMSKQTKYVGQQITGKSSGKIKSTYKRTKVSESDDWMRGDSFNRTSDVNAAVGRKSLLRETTLMEDGSDSDSLPCVGLDDYNSDDLPDPTWPPPSSKDQRLQPVHGSQKLSSDDLQTKCRFESSDHYGRVSKETPGHLQGKSSQYEDEICLVKSVLPHVSRTEILSALRYHSGNVDLCVTSLLENDSQ